MSNHAIPLWGGGGANVRGGTCVHTPVNNASGFFKCNYNVS